MYPLEKKGGQRRPAQGCAEHRLQPVWVIDAVGLRVDPVAWFEHLIHAGRHGLTRSCALDKLQKSCWPGSSVWQALPTSSVGSGHSTKETWSRKVGREHKGRAFVSVPRLNLSSSNGTLGWGKSFVFYFHSKAPSINYFWQNASVLSVHSLAWGFDLKHICFGESNGFTLVVLGHVIDFSLSLLNNVKHCSRHCQSIS